MFFCKFYFYKLVSILYSRNSNWICIFSSGVIYFLIIRLEVIAITHQDLVITHSCTWLSAFLGFTDWWHRKWKYITCICILKHNYFTIKLLNSVVVAFNWLIDPLFYTWQIFDWIYKKKVVGNRVTYTWSC